MTTDEPEQPPERRSTAEAERDLIEPLQDPKANLARGESGGTSPDEHEQRHRLRDDDLAAENRRRVIRAKGTIDGSTTLSGAADKVRELANHLQSLHDQGYTLCGPIEDDFGFVHHPDEDASQVSPEVLAEVQRRYGLASGGADNPEDLPPDYRQTADQDESSLRQVSFEEALAETLREDAEIIEALGDT